MRMSVNDKDIIRMYLGCNWLITQKTLPINAFLCTVSNGFKLCSPIVMLLFGTNNIFL